MAMLSTSKQKVVVIGAGIVGISAAYFLSCAGVQVTVVEGEAPSAGATGASDGAVSVGTKRPGLMMDIAIHARGLYQQLLDDGTFTGLYHPRKTFLIARGREEFDLVIRHVGDLNAAGEAAFVVERSDLNDMLPGLGDSVVGGGVVPGDGHALGYQITHRLMELSTITLLKNTAALELESAGGTITGIRTKDGVIAADTVIVAAGLGSRTLLNLPDILIPRKGQMLVTDRVASSTAAMPGHIISAAYLAAKRAVKIDKPQIGLVIDPLVTGQLLIGGTRESHNDDRRTEAAVISDIVGEAIDLYPAIERCRVIRTFSGIRTASQDGLPILGPSPTLNGLVIATGFEGDGICLGPIMGRTAAEYALGRTPTLDVKALNPARFWKERVA